MWFCDQSFVVVQCIPYFRRKCYFFGRKIMEFSAIFGEIQEFSKKYLKIPWFFEPPFVAALFLSWFNRYQNDFFRFPSRKFRFSLQEKFENKKPNFRLNCMWWHDCYCWWYVVLWQSRAMIATFISIRRVLRYEFLMFKFRFKRFRLTKLGKNIACVIASSLH